METMTAEEARIETYKAKNRARDFAYTYYNVVDEISNKINEAISNLKYECVITLACNRPGHFLSMLRNYYERLGYEVEISEPIVLSPEEGGALGYREVKLSW